MTEIAEFADDMLRLGKLSVRIDGDCGCEAFGRRNFGGRMSIGGAKVEPYVVEVDEYPDVLGLE